MRLPRKDQERALLDLASKNKRDYTRGGMCTVPNCDNECHGYFTNKEAHDLCMCPTARITELRERGWEIHCIAGKGKLNTFHVLRKTATQQDLQLDERLFKIGMLPNGFELYEVAK